MTLKSVPTRIATRLARNLSGFVVATILLPGAFAQVASKDRNQDPEVSVEQVAEMTQALNSAEQDRRTLLGTLSAIQQRVKKLASEKGRLTEELFQTEHAVGQIASQIKDLELRRDHLKASILRRLQSAYKLSVDGLAAALFSSQNSFEMDSMLRGIKIVSQHDYQLIQDYRNSLRELKQRRRQLDLNVKKLLRVERRLAQQEKYLTDEHKAKTGLAQELSVMVAKRQRQLSELKLSARQSLEAKLAQDEQAMQSMRDLLKPGLFELKGKLKWPAPQSRLVQAFGVRQDPQEGIRLNHKGFLFAPDSMTSISMTAVADAVVMFRGVLNDETNLLVLDHGDHYYSIYQGNWSQSAQSPQAPSVGQKVTGGQWLGATAPRTNLYFELRHFTESQNPALWLEPKQNAADRSLVLDLNPAKSWTSQVKN